MQDPSGVARIERLIQESSWVHGLAVALVRDRDIAADVAQDTLLTAMTSSPREADGGRRAWYARVIRNNFHKRYRAEQRRSAREQRIALPERHDSTDAVERAELVQLAVAAVLDLDEPFRATLLWHYAEGIELSEIAARDNVPAATVRSRLRRGLEKVRAYFDRCHGGDRERWLRAMVVVFELQKRASTTLGTVALTVTVLMALGISSLIWNLRQLPTRSSPGGEEIGALAPPANVSIPRVPAPSLPVTAFASIDPPAEAEAEVPVGSRVAGTVFDIEGRTWSRVPVGLIPGAQELARSDSEGRFEFYDVGIAGAVGSVGNEVITLLAASLPSHDTVGMELAVVVGSRVTFEGRVVDSRGRGIGGAVVRSNASHLASLGSTQNSANSLPCSHRVTTNVDGHFRIDTASLAELQLVAHAEGYRRATHDVAEGSREFVVIELEGGELFRVSGRVWSRSGAPAIGASVVFLDYTARVDESGYFALEGPVTELRSTAPLDVAVIAYRAGEQLAAVPDAVRMLRERDDHSLELDLQLGSASLSISGSVVCERPGTGYWEVRLYDGTRFGWDVSPTQFGERLVSLVGNPVQSGSFEFNGLSPRSYRLELFSRQTALRYISDPVVAGSHDVEIVVPLDAWWDALQVRVTSIRGEPLQSVTVVVCNRQKTDFGSMLQNSPMGGATGEDGAIELGPVPRLGTELEISCDGFIRRMVVVPGDHDPREPMRVQLEETRQFRVVARADLDGSLRVEDAGGEALALSDGFGRAGRIRTGWKPIVQGRSGLLQVSERARWLVIREGGKELQRVALRLVDGDVTEIHLR